MVSFTGFCDHIISLETLTTSHGTIRDAPRIFASSNSGTLFIRRAVLCESTVTSFDKFRPRAPEYCLDCLWDIGFKVTDALIKMLHQ